MEEKEETVAQHDKLPVLQLCPGGLRGVTAAVTLPAKAMAATKETRELEKSIVNKSLDGNVMLKVLFV